MNVFDDLYDLNLFDYKSQTNYGLILFILSSEDYLTCSEHISKYMSKCVHASANKVTDLFSSVSFF